MRGDGENHPHLRDKVFLRTLFVSENDSITPDTKLNDTQSDEEAEPPAKRHRASPTVDDNAAAATISITNLSTEATIDDIMKAGEEYGSVLKLRILSEDFPKICGFVCYRIASSATNAVRGLHGRLLRGRELRVYMAETPNR